jgi:flagellar biosynthesis protein FliR
VNPSTDFLVAAALALRCFGCVVSLPIGEALSLFPRFLLAIGVSLFMLPLVSVSGEVSPLSLVIEFVIGFVLGAPLRCVADIAEMIGELIDTARGQTISAILDPLHGQGSSDLATLAKAASVVVAITCGGLEAVVLALARSIQVIPLGSLVSEPNLVHGVLRSGTFALLEGMRLCAVWVGAFLLIDIGCSISSRVMSGMTFTQTATLLKMLATFLLLLLVLQEGRGRLSLKSVRSVVAPWEWASAGVRGTAGVGGSRAGEGGARGER